MVHTTPLSAAKRNAVLVMRAELETFSFDETRSHDHLRALVPRSLQDRYYLIVGEASTILNNEIGAVFECVRGVGYRRLPNEIAAPRTGIKGLTSIRRTANRYRKRLVNVMHHANDLSPEIRRAGLVHETKFGLIDWLTRSRTRIVPPDPDPMKRPGNPLDGLREALGL